MKMNLFPFLVLLVISAVVVSAAQPATDKLPNSPAPVLPVTAEIHKKFNHNDDFYQKYVSADGLLILGSSNVTDRALREARYLILSVLKTRPDVLSNLVARDVRVGVMAYTEFTTDIPEHSNLSPWMNLRARGLGGNPVTCGEENLLQYPGDRYTGENILIHEFAHIIDRSLGEINPDFKKRLRALYETHQKTGHFSGYGLSNPGEFWAEGVQSWFDTNKNGGLAITNADGTVIQLNDRTALKTHMPELAAFVQQNLHSNTWVYTPVATRLTLPYLKGYNPADAPTFVTPDNIREEGMKHAPDQERARESRSQQRENTQQQKPETVK